MGYQVKTRTKTVKRTKPARGKKAKAKEVSQVKLKWSGKKSDSKKGTKLSNDEIVKKIQNRAFSLYEKRGNTHGNDLEDWFKAEKDVAKELKSKKFIWN